MAVEKMEMIDLVGRMDDIDEIARELILSSSVHMVNAITEIQQNNFPILKAQNNVDALIDYNYIKQYVSKKDLQAVSKKVKALLAIFEIKDRTILTHLKDSYNFSHDAARVHELYQLVQKKHEKLTELNTEVENLSQLDNYLFYIKDVDVDLTAILNMKYIKMKIGRFTIYNMDKLKKNYENISSIVFKLYQNNDEVIAMLFVPEPVEIEVDRVLMSLNFDEFKPDIRFVGTPGDWVKSINERKRMIKSEIEGIRHELQNIKKEYSKEIEVYNSRLSMEYKIEELKAHIACTNEFFYLTGWVPQHKKRTLQKCLSSYQDNLIIIFKETKETREGMQPPTCLKNNYFVKPFESVVKLYGVPSYNELDPTAFLGISYMLLFGAMFGDVGQGLVLFLAGEILNRLKHRPNLGGVVARLGLSSIVFGFLYGSIFGYENILKPIVVKPMESINLMLLCAVALGVVLLSIGFIYNLINSYKNKDLENGIFSRNGIVGLVFYWLLLYFIIIKITGGETFMPGSLISIILIILLLLMLLKEPIANIIKGKRPLYSESKADYYVEGGFGIVETLLSLFSNTVSFIRVGAFAINHVGLFVAFETLAEMMTNKVEGTMMIILGNIIIICLEGLIVFIQGLRLEYYELFSKYYTGVGYEYSPCILNIYKKRNKDRFIKIAKKQKISEI